MNRNYGFRMPKLEEIVREGLKEWTTIVGYAATSALSYNTLQFYAAKDYDRAVFNTVASVTMLTVTLIHHYEMGKRRAERKKC